MGNSEIFLSFKEDQRRKGYVLEITNDGKFDYESFKKSTAVAKHGWGIGLHGTRRWFKGRSTFPPSRRGRSLCTSSCPSFPASTSRRSRWGRRTGAERGRCV